MPNKIHVYNLSLNWTGANHSGTTSYRAYKRDYIISIEGKPDISGSSDPAFLGDPLRYNPEELLLASIAGCHMLWFLHFCAVEGVVVTSYKDEPVGIMQELKNGSGAFTEATLNPQVVVTQVTMLPLLPHLHQKANQYCFIANSLNFKVHHKPTGSV